MVFITGTTKWSVDGVTGFLVSMVSDETNSSGSSSAQEKPPSYKKLYPNLIN
jgi:hypothetical protein